MEKTAPMSTPNNRALEELFCRRSVLAALFSPTEQSGGKKKAK